MMVAVATSCTLSAEFNEKKPILLKYFETCDNDISAHDQINTPNSGHH